MYVTISREVYMNFSTRIFKFAIPDLSSATATLNISDIIEYFDVPYISITQSSTYYKGKLYIVAGIDYQIPNSDFLYVVDLAKKELISYYQMTGYYELECVFWYKDEIYIGDGWFGEPTGHIRCYGDISQKPSYEKVYKNNSMYTTPMKAVDNIYQILRNRLVRDVGAYNGGNHPAGIVYDHFNLNEGNPTIENALRNNWNTIYTAIKNKIDINTGTVALILHIDCYYNSTQNVSFLCIGTLNVDSGNVGLLAWTWSALNDIFAISYYKAGDEMTVNKLTTYVPASWTKGDIAVFNGTKMVRLPVGSTNGQVLTVDSSEPTGLKWA